MNNKPTIEYPAFVFEQNGLYTADCVLYNLAIIGTSEVEAIDKLQDTMNKALEEFEIKIKPIYEKPNLKAVSM